jgi:hypothetical protein
MTTEEIKETYNALKSEQLFNILVIMVTRKNEKRFDSFSTAEQVNSSINMLLEIFKNRGIVFKKLDRNNWKESEFNERKTYIKLYESIQKGEMTFNAIGQR